MAESNNQDPYKFSIMFEDHLNHIFDSATGYHSQMVQDKDDPSKWNLYRWKDQNVKSLCNEAGGEYLVGELRTMVFNKHTVMGNLEQTEIADITAHCSGPINMLVFYSKKYGVEEKALVQQMGLDIDIGVYTFLTSVRDGGMREFGKNILTVNVVQRPLGEMPPQPKGLLG